jgi:hypothetical protein
MVSIAKNGFAGPATASVVKRRKRRGMHLLIMKRALSGASNRVVSVRVYFIGADFGFTESKMNLP